LAPQPFGSKEGKMRTARKQSLREEKGESKNGRGGFSSPVGGPREGWDFEVKRKRLNRIASVQSVFRAERDSGKMRGTEKSPNKERSSGGGESSNGIQRRRVGPETG